MPDQRVLRLFAVLLLCSRVAAAEPAGPSPTIPVEKNPERHVEFLAIAKAGGVDLLFLGDSITDGWRRSGSQVWDQYFAPLKAANFGISADRTEHVIWRLRHGELEGIQPKLVVLMIGTNNTGDPAADVALGIKTIITDIQERSPPSRILLLGIFPRGQAPANRTKNDAVNAIIAGYADNRRVVYQDIGQVFLAPDGTLPADIMPDLLHPNAKGYQLWADAIIDTVKRLLQADPSQLAPRFPAPSPVAKVAKLEQLIAAGKVGTGVKALDKLSEDKDAETARAAAASLAVVTAWRKGLDDEIAALRAAGDVFLAAELLTGMSTSYGGDIGKEYKAQAGDLKEDPAYDAGKAYQNVLAVPYASRRDPRFAKMVADFLKKYPEGYYADQGRGLLPKD